MVIFHSYVSLPEGTIFRQSPLKWMVNPGPRADSWDLADMANK